MATSATRSSIRRALTFLAHGDIERRKGGWRYGAATIGDNVIDHLAEIGRVRIDGSRAILLPPATDEAM